MVKNSILFTLVFAACVGCGKPKQKPVDLTPKVTCVQSYTKTIPIVVRAVGHCTAINSAKIKAQVEGELLALHFIEGTEVQEGDLLFTIDPRPYQAKLALTLAMREQNIAKRTYAEERVKDYRPLLPDNYVAQLTFTQYETELAETIAEVKQNDAEVALAEINLNYCYIRAPFTGMVGKKLIDIGNLIVNDGSPLLLINQMDPMYIDFSVPERDFWKLSKYQKSQFLDVRIVVPDCLKDSFVAKLTVIDNKIDQSTGMIPLRAEIANKERVFWPGQFVRAEIILTHKENAIMVPAGAVNMGQKGRYVYVVNKNSVAEYRQVEVGEQIDNELEITRGVSAGESVVIEGQINVLPNKKVEVVS